MIRTAYAVININALAHNVQQVRLAAPNSKIMAVIKANAYGHGLLRIAHALNGLVDGFAVARVQEGVRLRKAGLQQRIVVLEGFTEHDELQDLLDFNLEASLHSPHQLAILKNTPDAKQLGVWVKFDTGMNRLGFKAHEITNVYEQLTACNVVKKPLNFMTHFANADDKNDSKTAQQIALFHQWTANYDGEKSMANSAGILAWRDSLTDWVRAGVMLFGISPFADSTGEQLGLQPLMSLHSRLIAVRDVAAGETVGYGDTWTSPRATKLGVVAIGYGDGYPRYAQNGTPVLVNGERVPLVGRVSMDMITVDLGLNSTAKASDSVTLWGENLPIEEIALCSNTIPYTLVCGVTPRVEIVESKRSESFF
ncbi:MAG: alanine racemase [Methylococcaceae bacterium]